MKNSNPLTEHTTTEGNPAHVHTATGGEPAREEFEPDGASEALGSAQQHVKETLARYLNLYDLAPVGYVTLNQRGLIHEINLAAADMFGVARDSLFGQPLSRFLLPEDQNIFVTRREESIGTCTKQGWEMCMLRHDGTTFWVYCQAIPERNGEFWLILNDITELQHSRQEMLKTQKLESLGVLAGGIAHDFNNILTAILGNISLARLQINDPDKVTKRLEEAETAANRAKNLTRQLITFSRGGEPVKQVMELDTLLREAASFALHGSPVRCEFTLGDDLWPVEADEGQMRQVIHNLVLNAVQAMPGGGTLIIGADNVISGKEQKKFVKICVADSGIGIPAHHMPRIFDPYFTTKQNCNGLGLATCHSILKKHGGKIRAFSTPGQGSAFYVSLPALDRINETVAPHALPHPASRKHLLVMDDEAIIRKLVEAILTEFDYSVECVENGDEAVELYLKRKLQGAPFSAVILDLTIPGGVGGRETIAKLLAIDPDVKAIVSSGYSDDPVIAHFRDFGFSAALGKPYRPQEMNRVLQEVLAH